jgi:hypothetical protein
MHVRGGGEEDPMTEPAVRAPHANRRHTLKTWPIYFDAVYDGDKTFEVRLNDRGYQVGDVLLLQRWDPELADYTRDGSGEPATIAQIVTYVLPGGQFGIEDGYVVMGIRDV